MQRALLPFVLPQIVGGLIWGYARIRYGWCTPIIMHMAYRSDRDQRAGLHTEGATGRPLVA